MVLAQSSAPTLVAIALLASGCATSSSAERRGQEAAPAPAAAAPHGAAEKPAGGGKEDGAVMSGVVRETMNSGGYSYMHVELDDGQRRWTAAEETEVTVGDQVTLRVSMKLTDFHSKTLERTFDSIWFVYIERIQRAGQPNPEYTDTI